MLLTSLIFLFTLISSQNVGDVCKNNDDCFSPNYCDSTALRCFAIVVIGSGCDPTASDFYICECGSTCDQGVRRCVESSESYCPVYYGIPPPEPSVTTLDEVVTTTYTTSNDFDFSSTTTAALVISSPVVITTSPQSVQGSNPVTIGSNPTPRIVQNSAYKNFNILILLVLMI